MGSKNYENPQLEKSAELFCDYPITVEYLLPTPSYDQHTEVHKQELGTWILCGECGVIKENKDMTSTDTDTEYKMPHHGSEERKLTSVSITLKRRAGRPERETPIQITEVPKKGSATMTDDQLRWLKKQRARDLNTEASKRFRDNRKKRRQMMERECEDLERKNCELKRDMRSIEAEVDSLKERCRSRGLLQDNTSGS